MRLPELDKPLHTFSGDELYDLFNELRTDDWLERERAIEEAVDRYMQFRATNSTWTRGVGMPPYQAAFSKNPRFGPDSVVIGVTTTMHRVTIDIPFGPDDDYVRAFAEQMIRDQLYPQED